MDIKAKAIKGLKWTSARTFVVTILQFAQSVILARLLEPSEFGVMATALVAIALAQTVGDIGLSNAIIQRDDLRKLQLDTIYWLSVILGIVLAVSFVFSSSSIATFFDSEEVAPVLMVVSLIFILQPIGHQQSMCMRKELQFDKLAKIAILSKLSGFICAVLLAFRGFGAFSLAWAAVVENLLLSIMHYASGRSLYRPEIVFRIKSISSIYSFGIYQIGERMVNFFVKNIDRILIGRFLGMEALGFYNLAWNLVMLPHSKIAPIISSVSFPVFTKIRENSQQLQKYYSLSFRIMVLIVTPVAAIFYFCSDEIVNIVYGEKWARSAIVVQILTIIGATKALGNLGGSVLLAKGRVDVGFWWNLMWSFVLSVCLTCAVILYDTIDKIALVLLITHLLVGWFWHYLISKYGSVKYREILLGLTVIVFTNILFAYGARSVANVYFNGSDWSILFSFGIIYGLLLVIYLYFGERKIISKFRDIRQK